MPLYASPVDTGKVGTPLASNHLTSKHSQRPQGQGSAQFPFIHLTSHGIGLAYVSKK